jgi:Zn-dependent protease
MNSSIRLGRAFGIEINVNWSVIFVFALVSWTLATAVLPADVPDQPTAAYWISGVAGGVLFYLGLLAHELAHSLVARRNGVQVSGITLWLFGGVSQITGEPRSAGIEALLTVVGPLTSIAFAVILFLLGTALSATGSLPLVVDVFYYLAILNVGLGVFNLIPAFPLDGGRLLEAFFWWRFGSRQRGVHAAVQVGRFFSFLLIAYGVFMLFQGNVLNGIWTAFIGWFLLSAAGAEESATVSRAVFQSLPVTAVMSAPVVTVPDSISVEEFLASNAVHHPFTTYPVHDDAGSLTGVVRLNELVRAANAGRGRSRLRDLAVPISEMPTARPDENLEAMVERVGSKIERRVLVFDGTRLAGIVSPNDLARLVRARQVLGTRSDTPAPVSAR